MSAWMREARSRFARDLAYLTVGLCTSVVAMAVWITGVSVSLSLAVFIVGIPAIIATAVVFRWTVELDRRNAALVLGAPIRGSYDDHRGEGWLARVSATAGDPQTWRDLAWLVLHSVVGLTLGSIAVSLVIYALGFAVLPAWYWALPDGADIGLWNVDTLEGALVTAPLAIPLALLALVLMGPMARAEAGLARALLGPSTEARRASAGSAAPERAAREPGAGLPVHVTVAALAGFVCTLLWGLTSRGYFWPSWVWLGLALTVALHAVAVRAQRVAGDREQELVARAWLASVVAGVCVCIWALAGGGYFWPVWPALGLAVALALKWLFTFRYRLPWVRERQLVERVDELTRTRRGALDVQAAELRRIERDLHDGAQARLVALSMQLGRAEERVSDRPEVADLLRQARGEASAAIAELRDLARGIAPPVLADRGLEAAVESLGRRAPMAVTVSASVPRRPPPVLETAAYFVAAEALTNVAKHAPSAAAVASIVLDDEQLTVEVADDGPGGADPTGGGLTGLRHRVEALDGTLSVTSPPGAGTTIRAVLPCAS